MKKLLTVLLVLSFIGSSSQKICQLKKTSLTDVYRPAGAEWQPGDTIELSGCYGLVDLGNFKGTKEKPIIFKNNGLVTIKTLRIGVNYVASYFKILGNLDPKIRYGIKITNGFSISLADHLEIAGIDASNPKGTICFFKINPNANPLTQYPNYTARSWYIHHNYFHNSEGEIMYIGFSGPLINKWHPIRMDSIEIAYNKLDSAGYDAIQLSHCQNGCKIHHNTVTNFGLANRQYQQAGIILGGNTTGEIYENIVKNGTGNGIEAFGYGVISIYNNTIENTGDDGTLTGQPSFFSNDYINAVEPRPKQQIKFYDNIIKGAKPSGAVFITNRQNNSEPPVVTGNIFCGGSALIVSPSNTKLKNNQNYNACTTVPKNKELSSLNSKEKVFK